MTDQEKHNHYMRFRRFQQSREKFFAPKISASLHHQYLQFTKYYPHEGMSALHKIDSGGLAKVIKSIYIDAGTVYGAKIRADIQKHIKVKPTEQKARMAMGFSERMHDLLVAYFNTDILNTSENITQTTRELIRQVFINAAKVGQGIDDIVKYLEGTELSKIRARLIARTETVTAANKGALFVAKQSGLQLNKIWLATKDSRTRDDHAEVDGNQVGKEDYFIVGGYDMQCPGDRGGKDGKLQVPAREIVNCRCTTIFQPVRDGNGRLVRES